MTTVVAFDYNGTLNTEEGLEFYKSQASEEGVYVGVVTANLVVNVRRFIESESIEPDFIRRGVVKSPELMYISSIKGSKHIMVGNSITDKIAADIAGWKYIDVSKL